MKRKKLYAFLTALLMMQMSAVSVHAEQKPFIYGEDTWKLNNTSAVMGSHYSLTAHDRAVLEQNLSHTERYSFEDVAARNWLGSCYGIAVTSLLSYYGMIDPQQYSENAEHLYDLEATEEVLSLINYYHFTQLTDAVQQADAWSMYYETDDDRLERLMHLLSDGKPALLCFAGHFYDLDSIGGHAVVAYGCEKGAYAWDGHTYDTRILTYDSNLAVADENYCLYYDTEHRNWCIPGYLLNSEDGDIIESVCADTALLNHIGLVNPTSYHSDKPHFAFLDTLKTEGDCICGKTIFDGQQWQDQPLTADIRCFSYAFGDSLNFSEINYISPDTDSGYYYTAAQEQPLDVSMHYEGLLMMAEGTAKTIRFSPEGVCSVQSGGQPYVLTIVSDANYPGTMYHIQAEGQADYAELSRQENGYLLRAASDKPVTVSVTDGNVTESLMFRTDAEEVFICQSGDTLSAAVDTDGNGTYETRLENLFLLGDVNQDGSVNASDATMVLIAAARLGTGTDPKLTASQKRAADVNQDGVINAVDATFILRHAAAVGTGTADDSI
ncbi:MAG: dockerin type I repeat-containing protein [Oscillospiraceae bacterium]|nr:dockerin type I repeat-containing protein [Oscillospiraceae bacterium]